jgi:tight adherence protein C
MLLIILITTFIAITFLILLFFPKAILLKETDEEMAGTGAIYQLKPLLSLMAKTNAKLGLQGYKKKIQKKMISAGDPLGLTPDEFISLCELGTIAGIFLFGIVLGFSFTTIFLGALLGFFLPNIWLSDTVKKRKHIIIRKLPDFLDVLTLTVEAGLDFGAALQKVISISKKSPLVYEFNLMMQEMKLGTTRYDALKNLGSRIDIPELSAFISSLLQADQLGASLGPTLRIQADQMRVKRMQRAEKAGGEASVKMLIPLMLFIFPAVFLILFGPIIIKFFAGGF